MTNTSIHSSSSSSNKNSNNNINNDSNQPFTLLRRQPITSLSLEVEEYQHQTTAARHYHLASDNPENVFLVALRTLPMDSRGVAHILEHTALCGSEKYPVRDPFFMMLRRSLNTFMNAFTSSDWTAYPFASQNKKDYYNLLDVYLDAVFFARLDPLDFAQEGHRLDFAETGNVDTDLVYKGVVFNEMKGAMSSPVSTLWQRFSSYLFPNTTYHFNSGGEPEEIPNLSYEQLLAFYRRHYHPSNALFMSYGDIPAAQVQERLQAQVLDRFDAGEGAIQGAAEQRYYAPLRVQEHYALDDDPENKTHHVIGWLLGDSSDLEQQLEAHLLANVLLQDSAAPLRQALETSTLGSAPSPLCGLEDGNREMSFICGIEGSQPEQADAVEQIVLSVLERVAEEGVPQERLESVLHQLELNQREVGGDGYPYGLQLILSGLSAAVHGGDPVALLDLDPVLAKLAEAIKDPDYIKRLLQRLLLENQHRVRLSLVPDTELNRRKEVAETERLAQIKQVLSTQQKQQIVELNEALAQRQEQQDDEEILPKVGIDDVPLSLKIPQAKAATTQLPVNCYEAGTNGLVYQEAVIQLPQLSDELLELLPLFTYCLPELGCGDRDYLALQVWQSAVSGGVSAHAQIRGGLDDEQQVQGYLTLAGKALARNHLAMTELLHSMLHQVRFDELERICDLVAQRSAAAQQRVTGQGHGLAMAAAGSGMSPAAALSFRSSGLAGISALKGLDKNLRETPTQAGMQLAEKFELLQQQLLAAPLQVVLIGEADSEAGYLKDIEQHWKPRSATDYRPMALPSQRQQTRQIWTTSTQVNFCAKAYATVPSAHPDAPVLTVLSEFLKNGYLHRAVREQGGAYGAVASQDNDSASFRFGSYRDPRLQDTLNDFDGAISWLEAEQHAASQLEQAILGVVSSIDKPGSPAGEAKSAFHAALYGRTAEHRQAYRQRILEVTLDDLQRVGETYFNTDAAKAASIAVITAADGVSGIEGYEEFERFKL